MTHFVSLFGHHKMAYTPVSSNINTHILKKKIKKVKIDHNRSKWVPMVMGFQPNFKFLKLTHWFLRYDFLKKKSKFWKKNQKKVKIDQNWSKWVPIVMGFHSNFKFLKLTYWFLRYDFLEKKSKFWKKIKKSQNWPKFYP